MGGTAASSRIWPAILTANISIHTLGFDFSSSIFSPKIAKTFSAYRNFSRAMASQRAYAWSRSASSISSMSFDSMQNCSNSCQQHLRVNG